MVYLGVLIKKKMTQESEDHRPYPRVESNFKFGTHHERFKFVRLTSIKMFQIEDAKCVMRK